MERLLRKKIISKRKHKKCAICGRKINLIMYTDKTYRGGHYFGKIPISTKKAWREALKLGTTEMKIGNTVAHVLRKDPKPYKHVEYWECPKCYWRLQ